MLDRYAELSDRFRLARGLHHRPAGRDGPDRARVLEGRLRAPGRHLLRRLADAHRAGQAAAGAPGPAAARRADQSPGSRRAQLAGKLPARVPARRHSRQPRSLLPRRRRHEDRRPEPADDHRLPRQLQRLPGRARRAARAAARGQERAGRGGRAHQDVRRSVPLPGDQGRAGAEPDQAARQGRAHRGAAGAQACALHVSGRAQERADGDRARSTSGRRTGRSPSSTTCRCTSSAAIASRSSAPTAPASPR